MNRVFHCAYDLATRQAQKYKEAVDNLKYFATEEAQERKAFAKEMRSYWAGYKDALEYCQKQRLLKDAHCELVKEEQNG